MIGAICGDVVGSVYEWHNIKTKDFELFRKDCEFTDDSVMTIAIAKAAIDYLKDKDKEKFRENCIKYMREIGIKYPNCGYGSKFYLWLGSRDPKPYNSFGNGSAMRVSSVGWIAESLEEAEELAKISAEVTHNHPEGIKGAIVTAGCIWLLRNGADKEKIKEYAEKYYDISFTVDAIRLVYDYDVTCQGTMPPAIVCFLEADSFEDTIRNAISIGGDSDTLAAIAGSIAEACYGVPKDIEKETLSYLTSDLKEIVDEFLQCIRKV